MTIIYINNDNVYQEKIYDVVDDFIEFGIKYLPFIFLKTFRISGHKIQLHRWITKRRLDEINQRASDMMEHITWE